MKYLALIVLLLGVIITQAQVDFQVRYAAFDASDSVALLVDHPNGNEVVRVFANTSRKSYVERGVLRERGDRILFPAGERFFCWDQSSLVTESLNQNRQLASVKALRLKRYQVNKTRLSLRDERIDSLNGLAAPLWRRWNGTFLEHPACQNLDLYQGKTLLTLYRKGAINLQAFKQQELLPFFNQYITVAAPGNLAGEAWVKPLIASPDRWLITSYWHNGSGLPTPWITALDTSGNVVWERASGGEVVPHFHPLGMILIVKENALLGQQLEASDARTGDGLWNQPLFDLYNTDSLFSFTSLNSQTVTVHDVAPVLGGSYTAVLMAHDGGKDPILFLLNDQGTSVYSYRLDQKARMARIQERDAGFALVTESGSWLFRPR